MPESLGRRAVRALASLWLLKIIRRLAIIEGRLLPRDLDERGKDKRTGAQLMPLRSGLRPETLEQLEQYYQMHRELYQICAVPRELLRERKREYVPQMNPCDDAEFGMKP
jgi:hypothetical protein